MSIRSFKRACARRAERERRRLAIAGRRGLLTAGATLGASAALAAGAQAATYTVTTTNDNNDGTCEPASDGGCSLRQAVAAVNNDGNTSDTIDFASGVTGTIDLSEYGALELTNTAPVTITGPGASTLTLSGGYNGDGGGTQIFSLTGGTAPSNLTITGLTLDSGFADSDQQGGAIEDTDSTALTLSDDAITSSYSQGESGGGAIWTNGPLTITDSTLSGDTAASGPGGAIEINDYAPLTLTGSTIENSTSNAGGGAIASDGPVTIQASTLTGNTATDESGGALYTVAGDSTKYAVSITNSTISGNTGRSGGAIFSENDLTLNGDQINDNTAISTGGGVDAAYGSLSMSGTTVSNNTSSGDAGGVFAALGGEDEDTQYSTTITNSTISNNSASTQGGGLELSTSFTSSPIDQTTVQDSTISDNTGTDGAGVDIVRDPANDPVAIESSTISGNTGTATSYGGGLLIKGDVYSAIELIDSTISGNTGGYGGGVSLGDGSEPLLEAPDGNGVYGSIGIDNSTIAGNSASTAAGGGGIFLSQYTNDNGHTSAQVNSTIVAGNTANGAANDLGQASSPPATSGLNDAFDLIQTPGTAQQLTSQSVITGVSPQLGPLTNNGGPTQTMLPAATSPVIDQGKAAAGLTTDQRGDPRSVVQSGVTEPPGGDGTDIGAVELATLPPSTPPSQPPSSPPSGKPAVSPSAPHVSGSSGADFSGSVTPDGLATTAHFEYGLDPKYNGGGPIVYDQTTPNQTVGSDFTAHPVTAAASGLIPNALYHVRLVASNASGTVTGPDQTFTTTKAPNPPPPVLGESGDVTPISGLVLIKLPPGKSFHGLHGRVAGVPTKGQGFIPLTQARQVPVGSQIDALRGTLQLVVASAKKHKTQQVRLSGGLFTLGQNRRGPLKGLTTFALKENAFKGAPSYASCTSTSAHIASTGPAAQEAKLKPKVLQTLLASEKSGSFRTKGRYAAATVRGTEWITEDRCDGTLTIVKRGVVAVQDFHTRKTIILHAGQRFLAKP
jgi:CSLREA domain-containing protein